MTTTTEFNYLLSEAEHIDGSNRYTFNYPAYWRQSIYSGLKVGIRSIKMIPAPVYFKLTNINICAENSQGMIDYKPINIVLPIAPNDHMDDLNVRFRDAVAKAVAEYEFIKPTDIALEYANNSLYLYINRKVKDIWFDLDDMDANEATKQMLHFNTINDIPDENKLYDIPTGPLPEGHKDRHLVRIKFTNVWDRDDLYVLSSLTDMSYNRYLGYTNNDFHPPKQYSIHNTDSTFWIELYDKTNTIPVELSPHSVMVIEMTLVQQGIK